MRLFKFNGKMFANLNGKDFFLLRCYRIVSQPVFYQVSGRTPLLETDLDSRRPFELVRTKTRAGLVVTVFAKEYFNYQSAAEGQELCFVGQTTAGAYFLALKYLAERFDLKVSFEALAAAVAEAEKSPLFDTLIDEAGSGQMAVRIRVGDGYGCVTCEEIEKLIHVAQDLNIKQPIPTA